VETPATGDQPPGRRDGTALGCVVCRETDGGFDNPEHPIPECLGNTTIVLPPGVVCDQCNHGPLARLDKAVCEFKPVSFRRSQLGVPSKSGKVPSTSMSNGKVEFRDGAPLVSIEGGQAFTVLDRHDDGTPSRFRLEWQANPPMTPRLASTLARGLLKMGLGLAWLRCGEDVLDPRLDHVRSIILGGPHAGYLAIGRGGDGPSLGYATVTYRFDAEEGTIEVGASFYGVEMFTHSRRTEPSAEIAAVASIIPFDVASM
jgi:hypothetical protein